MEKSNFLFYQSFVDLIYSTVETEELDPEISENMKDSAFRQHLKEQSLDASFIKEISPYLKIMTTKPQDLIFDADDYYIAIDMITNTYYICYKNLLMIDLDSYKDDFDVKTILPTHFNGELLRYRIFKSRNGYHAFVISHNFDRNDNDALNLMIQAKCDFLYTIFSHLRGWCVRLNKKIGESGEKSLYKHLYDLVDGIEYNLSYSIDPKWISESSENFKEIPIESIPEQEKLVNLHMKLCDLFKEVGPCVSFNIV